MKNEIEDHPEFHTLSGWLTEAARQRLDRPTTQQRLDEERIERLEKAPIKRRVDGLRESIGPGAPDEEDD